MVKLYSRVNVNTTVNRLVHQKADRSSLIIFNNDSTNLLYIGTDESLSSSDGIPVYPQTGLAFNKGLGDRPDFAYYGRSSAGTLDIRVFEAETPKEAV